MIITKFRHACFLVEEKNVRILVDPGNYPKFISELTKIDVILITHKHPGHFHLPTLKSCLKNNPQAKILANREVADLLDKESITYNLAEERKIDLNGVLIEGFSSKHELSYKNSATVKNTAYSLDKKFFYGGDSFEIPKAQPQVLALPIAGPWCKISESINFALKVKPKIVFPVHDGELTRRRTPNSYLIAQSVFQEQKIKFVVLQEGKETSL